MIVLNSFRIDIHSVSLIIVFVLLFCDCINVVIIRILHVLDVFCFVALA